MLKLHGFPVSNYVNMVEMALLEKGVPYEYVLAMPDQSPEWLAKSPRGKVPALQTPQGYLNEATVILEYLEDTKQGRPLHPSDPYARALVRALMKEIELYIELPARSCFVEAFFGGRVSESIKAMARENLVAGFATLKRHGKFTPYVAGDTFTLADIVFMFSADLAVGVGKQVFGIDLMAEMPEAKSLLQTLGELPNARGIAQRKAAAMPGFVAAMQAKFAKTG